MVFAYGEAENGSSEDVTSMTLGGKNHIGPITGFVWSLTCFFYNNKKQQLFKKFTLSANRKTNVHCHHSIQMYGLQTQHCLVKVMIIFITITLL